MEVLNSVPLYMADRMKEVKSDFAHFYFTDESLQQVEKLSLFIKTAPKHRLITQEGYITEVFCDA